MKILCWFGLHLWKDDGCICDRCGKTRNEGHSFKEMECQRCGMRRLDWLHTKLNRVSQAISTARDDANYFSGDGNNYIAAREFEDKVEELEIELGEILKEIELLEKAHQSIQRR